MLPGQTIASGGLAVRDRIAIHEMDATRRFTLGFRLLHRNAMLLRTLLSRIRLLPDGRGS